MFGYELALDATNLQAAVGMPNRDTPVSGLNSGAIMLYDLSLFSVRFASSAYEVMESDSVSVTFNRSDTSKSLGFKVGGRLGAGRW